MTGHTATAIVKAINAIEAEFPVDSWRYEGFFIWPLIRIELYFMALSRLEPNIHPSPEIYKKTRTLFKGWWDTLKAMRQDPQGQACPKQADAVFLSNGVSYDRISGRFFDRFCDPFIQRLTERAHSCLLLTPSRRIAIPRYTPSQLIQPSLDVCTQGSRLMGQLKPISGLLALEGWNHFIAQLKVSPYFHGYGTRNSLQSIYHIRRVADYFKRKLKPLKVKIGFSVCFYAKNRLAFNVACRELGIKTIDIQHGAQTDAHGAYGHWNKIPEQGYECLPDYFWCWYKEDASVIMDWRSTALKTHQPIVGGNLWLEDWKQAHYPEFKERMQSVTKRLEPYHGKKNVLVTLQPGLTGPRHLETLLQVMAQSPNDWHWWVRPHPQMGESLDELQAYFAKRLKTNYTLNTCDDYPLYAILPHMDVHVTHSSATVLEALSFNVPSIVFSEYGAALYQRYQHTQQVSVAVTFDEISQEIKQIMDNKTRKEARPSANTGFKTILALLGDDR